MATLFTRILNGEIPGRFVYRDDRCGAFLSIHPLAPGHTLVVPLQEVDHWLDADPDLMSHLLEVCRKIGQAQQKAFAPAKVGLMIAGLEVPHLHLHVVPVNSEKNLEFSQADTQPDPADLDRAAEKLRQALQELPTRR
ncbi:MAG: HIT family protein [Armatimonadetes bacterium]|nr:HIT family protein [Armatimonadota bacterium]